MLTIYSTPQHPSMFSVHDDDDEEGRKVKHFFLERNKQAGRQAGRRAATTKERKRTRQTEASATSSPPSRSQRSVLFSPPSLSPLVGPGYHNASTTVVQKKTRLPGCLPGLDGAIAIIMTKAKRDTPTRRKHSVGCRSMSNFSNIHQKNPAKREIDGQLVASA